MATKINHLVVLMMENRSFDHYCGALSLEGRTDIAGIDPAAPGIPDSRGTLIAPWKMDGAPLTFKPPHGWVDAHNDYNGGKNDGFVRQFQAQCPTDDPKIPMGYYTRATLPVLYKLADEFVVCDHWYASLLSSTWPNRKYLHSGRRDADNDTQTIPIPGFQTRPFYNFLEEQLDAETKQPLTWRCYFTDLPFLAFWYGFASRHLRNFTHVVDFVNDCREDALPTISIVDPPFTLADDHPNHDPRLGQKFIALVVDALTHSESWAKSALLILYDEFGGFYDHIPPRHCFETPPSEDDPLGFRVPAIVVSPFAKRSYVSKIGYDHTSVMRSISERWGFKFDSSFGRRWPVAPHIWEDCFDWSLERPMGTYTEPQIGEPAFKDLNWGEAVHQRLATPLDKLEDLLERIFILPELKALDKRSQLFETLDGMEREVITLKRSTRAAPLT